MNILQINSGRGINGALVYCKVLVEQLVESGHQVTMLTRPDSWLNDELMKLSVPYFTSNMRRFPPRELKEVAKWIVDNRIDVIHTHMSRAHSFGALLKLMTGVPVVKTAHSRSFQLHWRVNDYVIANSQATFDYHQRVNRIPSSKIGMVHCFVDIEKYREIPLRSVRRVRRQLRANEDDFLIGLVGEVVARKGHLHFFKALAEIVNSVPNAKVVILGRFHRNEPYTQVLRSILIQEKLFCKTKWLGLRFNVQDFMSAFDLCVVPSIEEPLGLVAIEAMAAGTPVVASDVGGLPEIVSHEVNGLLVKPRDPSALSSSVIRLAQDHNLRGRLGIHGKAMMHNRFDPASLTNQVVAIYDRVVSRHRAAA